MMDSGDGMDAGDGFDRHLFETLLSGFFLDGAVVGWNLSISLRFDLFWA